MKIVNLIQYEIVAQPSSFVTVEVSGLEGVVCETVDLPTQTGKNRKELNFSDLNAGIYFYSLLVDGQVVDARRMVIER